MGRKKTGHTRERNGRHIAEVAGEHLGVYDSKADAKRMIKAAINEDSGATPGGFGIWAADWMDRRELGARKRGRMRAFKKERSRWNAHVVGSSIWDVDIKHMAKNPIVVQKWIGELEAKEAVQIIKYKDRVERRPTGRTIGKRVIEDSVSLVKVCLDAARIAGKYRGDNPARVAELPKFEDPEVALEGDLVKHCWEDEIEALFGLEQLHPKPRSIFSVAIYVGLRPEELWGLQWQDVVLDGPKPCIRVRRTWSGLLKTKWARRDVPLLPPALRALRAWKVDQPATPIGKMLVWPNEDGKCHGESYTAGWRSKDDAGRHVEGWAEKAGIRPEIDFKDLRHTCGCHLAMGTWTPRGLTLMELKRWLGHSSISVTERHYASLTSDSLHAAISGKPDQRRIRDLSAGDD